MVIGLRWKRGYRHVEPISGGKGSTGIRTVVTFRVGDTVQNREPNHHEAGRLRTDAGESVVEIKRTDQTREVYRSSLVAFAAPDAKMLSLVRETGDGKPPEKITFSGTTLIFDGEVETPDLTKPQWQQIYEDLRSYIESGRLKFGDQIPTTAELAEMYAFSSPVVLKAIQVLQTEGWVAARQGLGRFVRCVQSTANGTVR